MRYFRSIDSKPSGTFKHWRGLAVMMGLVATSSVAYAFNFTHLPPTFSDTSLGALGGADYFATSAVRQDQNLWVIGIDGDGFAPVIVARKRFINGAAQPIEQLNDGTHFLNMAPDGQRMALFSYIGSSPTGDRNTVYAYVGSDNKLHYGQVKSGVPTNAFSQNAIVLPTAAQLPDRGTFDPHVAPSIAASGSCTLGGKPAGTCLYFFLQDSNEYIYYKWIDCPPNGDCSTLSASTTVQFDGTPVSTSWNRIESGGYIPSMAGPTAAQVTNNTIMVLAGIDSLGEPLSWNLAANTGALLLSHSWNPPSGGLFGSSFAATTYNRGVYASGTGCAQLTAIGNGANHTFTMATCDGEHFTTGWQDITGPGGLGHQSLSETFPGTTPGFDLTSGSLGSSTGSTWKATYVTN
jgi:hypothetical protein